MFHKVLLTTNFCCFESKRHVIRFVIPVVFNKLTRVECMYLSNTTLFDDTGIYSIYYIRYNYMFWRLTMAIFRLYMKCLVSSYTYLLTPWCRVLLEKLTGLQLVKKYPTFQGNRRFITALTSVRHLSLSWANPIQST